MKTKLSIVLLFAITIQSFSQNQNEGYIVEDDKNIIVEISNYSVPLKINRVSSQYQIN
ncbi:hypothetical protein ACHRVW_17135 [Flavobacterium collinsii]|jgi:hypothetical protein|nr:hypothetical protein Flavo103_32010 [Flavobacterium collinsii]